MLRELQRYRQQPCCHGTENGGETGDTEKSEAAPAETAVIECCAGAGRLSKSLAEMWNTDWGPLHLYLIDRTQVRHCADESLRRILSGKAGKLTRLTCDMADVCLDHLAQREGTRGELLVIGKHLCGSATDFSIRAAIDRAISSREHAYLRGTGISATSLRRHVCGETTRRRHLYDTCGEIV